METFFLDVARTFSDLHLKYIDQFLAALLPMVVTVILHGQGMGLAARCFKRFVPCQASDPRKRPPVILLIAIVTIMLVTHFLEVIAWALLFVQMNMLPDIEKAMYFSMNNYTTLGASDISLQGRWRGLAGFEAMTAMLMFGWSTAVLATVVQKLHSIDD